MLSFAYLVLCRMDLFGDNQSRVFFSAYDFGCAHFFLSLFIILTSGGKRKCNKPRTAEKSFSSCFLL